MIFLCMTKWVREIARNLAHTSTYTDIHIDSYTQAYAHSHAITRTRTLTNVELVGGFPKHHIVHHKGIYFGNDFVPIHIVTVHGHGNPVQITREFGGGPMKGWRGRKYENFTFPHHDTRIAQKCTYSYALHKPHNTPYKLHTYAHKRRHTGTHLRKPVTLFAFNACR